MILDKIIYISIEKKTFTKNYEVINVDNLRELIVTVF